MNEPLDERAARRLLAMAAEDDPAPPRSALPARYEILRELGRGGMGVVYEAFDRRLARRVAVKAMVAGPGADDEVRARFAREALATASLRHPHIAVVHDATPDYIAMQLVEGAPIAAVPGADPRIAVVLVRDAARALQHAHEQGVVHRDVKPSNLLVENGHVFVVDFGLAKRVDAGASVSLAGSVLGTPAFMPPEQALGQHDRVDARSDVYGLGATLFASLRGEPPFAANDLPSLLRAVVDADPPRLGVDPDLDVVVGKCLAKEREQRYASAGALADDLDRWLAQEPVLARPPSLRYRFGKRLRRHRSVVRAVVIAAFAAVGLTGVVLGPIVWRESVASSAASEAVALSGFAAKVLQDAELFQRLGDQESARQLLDDGIRRARGFLQRHDVPRFRYLLARLLWARGAAGDALVEIERTVVAAPDFAEARFERGLRLAAAANPTPEQVTTAIADLGVDLGGSPVVRDVDVLFGRAERARLSGDPHHAMELLREVLEYDGMHVAARLSLVRVALQLGLDDEARYYSASAIDMQAGYAPFYLAREQRTLPTSLLGLDALLVDFSGDLDVVADIAVARSRRAIVNLRRALRLEAEGRRADAIEAASSSVADHDAALLLHPDLAGALVNRAVGHLVVDQLRGRNGDAELARAARAAASADLDRAVALAPRSPEAHGDRGVLALREARMLRSLARLPEAAERARAAQVAFGRALALAPAGWPHTAFCRERLAAAAALGDGN
ncbi:MAG: serine/threonine protein kinase [Planctomycetes bacterium]|nr:serine/threonine protein kinase [Planctomycetota bacterium]